MPLAKDIEVNIMANSNDYFSGEVIYGDDLDQEEIDRWFELEEDGYSGLGYVDSETDAYPYHGMNIRYGWRFLNDNHIGRVLGVGSAFAEEFSIVSKGIDEIIIVEPGKKFWRSTAFGRELTYVMPSSSGKMMFESNSFDLVTAFGVLHHIPNVSYVMSELVRVLKPGGYLLIREPIITMGDWNYARPGLTKNERGIPLKLMRKTILALGCDVVSENLIGFSPLQRLLGYFKVNYWSSSLAIYADWFFCRIFSWNCIYHRKSIFDRFSPSAAFWVIRKREDLYAKLFL
jgi:SAM-dependent methyltransferase